VSAETRAIEFDPRDETYHAIETSSRAMALHLSPGDYRLTCGFWLCTFSSVTRLLLLRC